METVLENNRAEVTVGDVTPETKFHLLLTTLCMA